MMKTIISALFAARDVAHALHLRTRSFSAHLALGELYEALVELADSLAEMYQGKYGIMQDDMPMVQFSAADPITFIRELADFVESAKSLIDEKDTHMLNEWDNVIALVYKIKYKLENLS